VDVGKWYDVIAEGYDATYSRATDRAEDHVARGWLGSLANQRVLDVGCGTGLLVELRPEIDPARYLGYDVSAGMLAQARVKCPGYTFVQRDMRAGDWPGADVVVGLYGAPSYIGIDAFAEAAWHTGASRVVAVCLTEVYEGRQHYVPWPRGTRHWQATTAREAKQCFGRWWPDVQVRALDWLAEHVNGHLGVAVAARYLRVESAVLGIVGQQDRAGMVWVEGRR